ncbi:UNVERIFIED_CONTAM: hypothetical protein NCL1_38535 [Trichonephila clavipes]
MYNHLLSELLELLMAFYKKIKDTVSSSTLPITDSALAAMCQEFINKISCYLALPEMPDIGK